MISLALVERQLDLKLLKQIFLGFAGIALLGIFMDMVLTSQSYRRVPVLKESGAFLYTDSMKPLDSYESAFQAGGLLGTGDSSGLTVLKTSIGELIKDYRLQGVVILDQTEAILQDARTQQTVFAKTGDRLGELTVKEIKEGYVALTCYGEEAVLQIQ